MSFNNPFYQDIFQDLYRHSPRKGFILKALEALQQQQPLTALHYFLTVLEIPHDLTGERSTNLTFKFDPLSWGLRITGPIPQRKDALYAYYGCEARRFKVEN